MNKEDIKKALKMCADLEYCDDCPYFNWENRSCSDELKLDALNLITEQEKEIERLKAENKQYLDSIESVQAGRCRLRCPLTEQAVKQAKIEVLNKLKGKCHNYYPSIDHYCCSVKAVTLSDINNIIKELIK